MTIYIGTDEKTGIVVVGEDFIKAGDETFVGIDWSQVSSPDINIIAERRRAARKAAFVFIDKWQLKFLYESLQPDQQAELAAYRQAWLDYPDAPTEATTPVQPSWMD